MQENKEQKQAHERKYQKQHRAYRGLRSLIGVVGFNAQILGILARDRANGVFALYNKL